MKWLKENLINIFIILFILLVFAALFANVVPHTFEDGKPQANDWDIRFYTDEKTGCEYLIYWSYYGRDITPRLKSDGTVICNKAD